MIMRLALLLLPVLWSRELAQRALLISPTVLRVIVCYLQQVGALQQGNIVLVIQGLVVWLLLLPLEQCCYCFFCQNGVRADTGISTCQQGE